MTEAERYLQMEYKFEKLEVWKLAMELNDISYKITDYLPESEKN